MKWSVGDNLSILTAPFVFGVIGLHLMAAGNWASAGEIRKIVRADGVVEYTNVPSNQRKTPIKTNASKAESIYKYRQDNGVLTITNVKPKKGIQYETIRYECYACNPSSTVDWYNTPINTKAYSSSVAAAAKTYNVDPALIRAIIHAESSFKVTAKSHQGAQGLMQLMPATARYLGVGNPFDASENIMGGAKYLAELLALYAGDIKRASAAYNAGPGAVKKYNGVPPYAETKAYVKRVGILHKRYQQALR
ncbi:lytic transglycosylase domain-containing protein [Neptunomonas sp. CHC150]|jgi:soluble lytic murein transglycosylase-like protein|uniref:lytic transglycosylase domain-containing protein n=1 Tax=Neptunomonas TaxID=75687 RepID=UPI0009489927|nr:MULTISPECIES: lytic transglycosylase domain-containing protein [Neptunomonas]MDN2659748.1 lytic transglycosylase domain-containing protein [Neptunomonas sp. CHC150]